jgi:hypothetical protein
VVDHDAVSASNPAALYEHLKDRGYNPSIYDPTKDPDFDPSVLTEGVKARDFVSVTFDMHDGEGPRFQVFYRTFAACEAIKEKDDKADERFEKAEKEKLDPYR